MEDILYFYIDGLHVYLITPTGTVDLLYETEVKARDSLRHILSHLHKSTASIPSSDGKVYHINCAGLTAHSKSVAIITCQFDSITLDITCVSDTDANYQDRYLDFVSYSAHITENLNSRTLAYVDLSYDEDIPNKKFNSIASAISNSSPGTTIMINAGAYEEALILTNDIDLYFKENAILRWTDAQSDDEHILTATLTAGESCRVLGFLKIEFQRNVGGNNYCIAMNSGLSFGSFYAEFDEIEITGTGGIAISNTYAGNFFVKGRVINSSNSDIVINLADGEEGNDYSMDLDVLEINSLNDTNQIVRMFADIHYQVYIKNLYTDSKTNPVIAMQSGGFNGSSNNYDINIINCQLITTGNYVIQTAATVPDNHLRFWDLFGKSASKTINVTNASNWSVYFYNDCEGFKNNTNVSGLGNGSFTVNTSIEFVEGDLFTSLYYLPTSAEITSSNNKADYLEIIEKNVRDEAKNFIKSAIITAIDLSGTITIFTVSTTDGFFSGDEFYLKDSNKIYFGNIKEVNEIDKTISVEADLTGFSIGTIIKKNDAQQYLDNALLTYSKFRPVYKTKLYNLSSSTIEDLPEDWQEEFSEISSAKFPYVSGKGNELDERVYFIDLDENGDNKLFFKCLLTGDLLFKYSIPHSFEGDEQISTIPVPDIYAVCDIASAFYMLALASRYAQSTDPTIEADTVDYKQKPNIYIQLYNQYLNKASMMLDIDVDMLKKGVAESQAASGNQEVDEEITDDNILIHTIYY